MSAMMSVVVLSCQLWCRDVNLDVVCDGGRDVVCDVIMLVVMLLCLS